MGDKGSALKLHPLNLTGRTSSPYKILAYHAITEAAHEGGLRGPLHSRKPIFGKIIDFCLLDFI